MPPQAAYPGRPAFQRSDADRRGWGPGWPDCQPARMATFSHRGWPLRFRREIVPLVQTLIAATEQRGYQLRYGECWSYNCRAIAGTQTPSNHSWGLAIDINAPANPMSTRFVSDMPTWLPGLWWESGFYWGGWFSRPDPMHLEYLFRPADVAGHLARARRHLHPTSQEDDDVVTDADKIDIARRVAAEMRGMEVYDGKPLVNVLWDLRHDAARGKDLAQLAADRSGETLQVLARLNGETRAAVTDAVRAALEGASIDVAAVDIDALGRQVEAGVARAIARAAGSLTS